MSYQTGISQWRDFSFSQAMDVINMDAVYTPTTLANARAIASGYEDFVTKNLEVWSKAPIMQLAGAVIQTYYFVILKQKFTHSTFLDFINMEQKPDNMTPSDWRCYADLECIADYYISFYDRFPKLNAGEVCKLMAVKWDNIPSKLDQYIDER